jgi:hypothetical protein
VKATSIKDLKAREPTKPETDQKFEFTCVVDDRHANEHFDAKCIFEKKFPITRSRKDKRIALAHIYIIAVSDQEWNDLTDLRFITNKAIADAWGKKPTYKAHGHFILFNIDGDGKYIRRDRRSNEMEPRLCSTQDLGPSFDAHVARILVDFAR